MFSVTLNRFLPSQLCLFPFFSSYFVTRVIDPMMILDQQRARGITYSIQLVYTRTSPIVNRNRRRRHAHKNLSSVLGWRFRIVTKVHIETANSSVQIFFV